MNLRDALKRLERIRLGTWTLVAFPIGFVIIMAFASACQLRTEPMWLNTTTPASTRTAECNATTFECANPRRSIQSVLKLGH
ncbi:hypothetical protein D3C71_1266060 [compost metagenome]